MSMKVARRAETIKWNALGWFAGDEGGTGSSGMQSGRKDVAVDGTHHVFTQSA
jgi:hypothetical protein